MKQYKAYQMKRDRSKPKLFEQFDEEKVLKSTYAADHTLYAFLSHFNRAFLFLHFASLIQIAGQRCFYKSA